MFQRSFVTALIALLAATSTARANQSKEPPAGRGTAQTDTDAADVVSTLRATNELIGMLDAYATIQAQQALQLSDEQYGRFIPLLKKLQETRRRNQQARNRMIGELRRLAGPRAATPADDGVLVEKLRALREQDERAAAEIRAAVGAIDEILTPQQQARFRIFEEHIENRKLDLLLRARARAGRQGRL
jgi:hypothetical protein